MNSTSNEQVIINSYYTMLSCLFCSIVILGNLFALKTTTFFGLLTPGGMICFPFTFSICDIITEVYGEEAAKKTIKMGLTSLFIYFFTLSLVTKFPAAPGWEKQEYWESIFSMSYTIFLGTFIAYYFSERINSFILSALKYICNKQYFLRRSIISTFFGVTVDTFLFNLIAFFWFLPFSLWITITISQLVLKLLYEIIGSGVATLIVPYLKKYENLDPIKPRAWIDKYFKKTHDTNFSCE